MAKKMKKVGASKAVIKSTVKSCPFCGSDDITVEQSVTYGSVQCKECTAKIVLTHTKGYVDGMYMAIALWNRRSNDR